MAITRVWTGKETINESENSCSFYIVCVWGEGLVLPLPTKLRLTTPQILPPEQPITITSSRGYWHSWFYSLQHQSVMRCWRFSSAFGTFDTHLITGKSSCTLTTIIDKNIWINKLINQWIVSQGYVWNSRSILKRGSHSNHVLYYGSRLFSKFQTLFRNGSCLGCFKTFMAEADDARMLNTLCQLLLKFSNML